MADWIIYVVIAALTVGFLAVMAIVVHRKMMKDPLPSIDDIVAAFGAENIERHTYVRNKINVVLKDVKQADLEGLKSAGATGVNVVGKTVKCYFPDRNKDIYDALCAAWDKKD